MNTKIPFTWIVLLGLMSSITLGVLLEESQAEESNFIFGSAHEHASISIKIFDESFDLTQTRFQLQSQFIHLENSNGYVIHRHSDYVKLGYLFETLNLGLSQECFIIDDEKEFCSNDDYTLKFYINGKKVQYVRDHLIIDGDLILISYGSENPEEIAQQLAELKDRGFPFKLRDEINNYSNF